MARIKRAQLKKTRKKNLFRRVRGFFVGRQRLRQAIEARMHAEKREFIGRKQRKRKRRKWRQRHGGRSQRRSNRERRREPRRSELGRRRG